MEGDLALSCLHSAMRRPVLVEREGEHWRGRGGAELAWEFFRRGWCWLPTLKWRTKLFCSKMDL